MIVYNPTIEQIKDFFTRNEKNQSNFRYFKTRDFNIIKYHIKTILLKDKDRIVGYGHLDKDDNNEIWLGIMVCDECIGLGYGNIIIAELLKNQDYNIKLSVDIENNIAKKLYEKNGFFVVEKKQTLYIMKKNNPIRKT